MLVICNCTFTTVCCIDKESVKALKELRLTADDFEMKGIIGRGHFGEVMSTPLQGNLSIKDL